ncbi:hypothetical protein ACIA8G_37110 [Lentzea sp. NPDC051213]|uniref:hypothetical protein n=1 Tax=Lentzea sp. NPDC051213 TaxID=3364126 RepID=UPI0037A7153F
MLSHLEITARVTVTPAAHFVWSNRLELAHDCLVCLRVGRFVQLQHGQPYGLCTGNEHPAPIRVSGFDASDHGADRLLRCRVTSWWAPFADQMEPGVQASELTAEPWVGLNYRVGCHSCRDAGVDDWLGQEGSLHSDLTWPVTSSCPRCQTELVTIAEPPQINLV